MFNKFFELPLSRQIAVSVALTRLVDGKTINNALKAIDIRNRIVHEGYHPSKSEAANLKSLFRVVAALLEKDHKFPGLTSGNMLSSPKG